VVVVEFVSVEVVVVFLCFLCFFAEVLWSVLEVPVLDVSADPALPLIEPVALGFFCESGF
jgi:hypothetical protein